MTQRLIPPAQTCGLTFQAGRLLCVAAFVMALVTTATLLTAMAPRAGVLAHVIQHPAIVLFYSDNCAPCKAEMTAIEKIKSAAGDWHVAVVAMTPLPDQLSSQLNTLQIQHIAISQTDGDAFLKQANDTALGLPFSFALDRTGKICARRAGILGTDTIKDWRIKCSQ